MEEKYLHLINQWRSIPDDYKIVMIHNVSPAARQENPLYKRAGNKPIQVVGWYSGRFNIGFGSRFFSIGNGISDLISVSPQLLGYLRSWAKSYNIELPEPINSVNLQNAVLTLFNTIKFWVGYENIRISLSFQYIILDRTTFEYYRDAVAYLMSGVLPTSSSKVIITTPGGYLADASRLRKDLGSPPEGTWTVQIGRWFRYDGFLVTDVNYSFNDKIISMPVGEDGEDRSKTLPMSVDIQVSLEPWRLLLAEEAQRMFTFFNY